jgi:hypothetical protein
MRVVVIRDAHLRLCGHIFIDGRVETEVEPLQSSADGTAYLNFAGGARLAGSVLPSAAVLPYTRGACRV